MIKAAIWGAGNIAQTHAEALKSAGIQIAAVVDRSLQQAQKFAKKYNIPNYDTSPDILFGEEITAVHVCTPPNLHYEMVMQLLQHNKHVLCEKPLCFDTGQAKTLRESAQSRGLVCAVNFNVRFHDACQKARQEVLKQDFGPVLLVHGSYLQEFHALPAEYGWRYNPQLSGVMRAVTEIGTHWADISQFVSGETIQAVSAMFGKFNPVRTLEENMMVPEKQNSQTVKVDSEDAACVMLRFSNGAIGSMLLSEVSQGRVNRISLEITGQHKNLWWNSEENNLLCTASKGSGVNSEIFAFGNGFMDTFRSLVCSFYQAVQAGKPPQHPEYPDFAQGENIVRVCSAILQSANSNSAWVEV